MLSVKRRFAIFMVNVALTGAIVGYLLLPGVLNLNYNIRDPLFFDRSLEANYEYSDGIQTSTVDFQVSSLGASDSVLTTTFKGNTYQTTYTHDGYYVHPVLGKTEYYSIFWVHIVTEGERSEFSNLVGNTFDVIDPIGIIGSANAIYKIVLTERMAYWPEEAGVHGAQASYNFDIFSNNIRIGTGILDKTCGMVFTMIVNGITLKLLDTSYDISRNRIYALLPVIILVIAAPIIALALILLRKKYSDWEEPIEDTMDTVFLVGFAAVIAAIDIYNDVWMYATLGFAGNMILRAVVLGVGAVYSIYRGYKLKWVLPGIYEIAFVTMISLQLLGDSYAGHLTAAMGMTISLLCFIWETGKEPKQKEDKFIDRILSNIV